MHVLSRVDGMGLGAKSHLYAALFWGVGWRDFGELVLKGLVCTPRSAGSLHGSL